jgi:4-amino-4-deoxy-L-arabinose transferase-like glycosyltransferase
LNKKVKITKETLGLSFVLLLSALLNFVNLGLEGYANTFYSAAVKSMTMSFKNFFFVSFDPAGFVTIDKPPLGFWIQAISVKIFGFNSWGILIPQALAGVISVAVLYYLVKRSFGVSAGLISAACLATTPIFVAVSRNNTCDNLLVLTLLLACWVLSIAAEKGKIKYLLLSLAIVGIGFNIKMLQAYMIVPAIYITYLLSNAVNMKKRIIHLLLATLVLLAVSFSWALVVDLVPASNRPYVDSSTNNSEIELIVGWNGLNRLGLGGNSQMGGAFRSGMSRGEMPKGMKLPEGMEMPSGARAGVGVMGAGMMGGSSETSSITRLFSKNSLSDQIIWLFPLAIFGLVAAVLREKFKSPFNNDKRKLSLILWAMWLLPVFGYFSFTTGMFHPYYLTMLAPPIAALSGIGIISMWKLYKEGGWKSWILEAALIVDGSVQLLILSYFYSTSSITKILMIGVSILCFVPSIILIIFNLNKNENTKLKRNLLFTAVIGLLITPTVWSGVTMFYPVNGSMPSAGLEIISSKSDSASMGMDSGDNTKLIKFLETNNTNEKYILAVSTSMGTASDIIIKTGKSVMSLGGFMGSDKILTLNQFKSLVAKGEIRYVMLGEGMGGAMGVSLSSDVTAKDTKSSSNIDVKAEDAESSQNSEIMAWVEMAGTVVPESEWKDAKKITNTASSDKKSSALNNQQAGGMGGQNSQKLYDLKAYANSITNK